MTPSSGLPERLRGLLPSLMPPLFVALITVLATWLRTPTVLFPELAAIAAVVLLQPEAPWSRVPLHLVLAPFLTACIGQLCFWLLPWWPVTVAASVALSISTVRGLRSPMVPALSCGLAPWAFQLHSWIFAPSLLLGTGALALVCLLRPRPSHRSRVDWNPSLPETALLRWPPVYGLFLGLGLLLVALTGMRLILFPPLLVIAYEWMVHPEACPWRGRPVGMILGCTAAAAIGTLLASWWGVVAPATALTVVMVEALQRLLGFRMLPAYGAGLIPFLLPHPSLAFPLSVALGTGLLAAVISISGRMLGFSSGPSST